MIFIPLTVVKSMSCGRLKRTLFGWRGFSVARLNSVFGLKKVDQKPYNSPIKPTEEMQ
jgi:hypothetical protein